MTVTGYHAHVYFDQSSVAQATSLCERARDRFDLEMGRVHRKPVGPHPCWSCQLAFAPAAFGEVIPWLMAERRGLTVFTHALTGNDLRDHTDFTLWLGASEVLELSVF